MFLAKVNKNFPEDYIIYQRNKKHPENYKIGRYSYKYNKIAGKYVVKQEHHEITFLLNDLVLYDLKDLKDRAEFISVLTVAMLIDDYDLIKSKMSKITTNIKEITSMADLNEFIKNLEDIENKQKSIEDTFKLEEFRESKAKEKAKKNQEKFKIITVQDDNENKGVKAK